MVVVAQLAFATVSSGAVLKYVGEHVSRPLGLFPVLMVRQSFVASAAGLVGLSARLLGYHFVCSLLPGSVLCAFPLGSLLLFPLLCSNACTGSPEVSYKCLLWGVRSRSGGFPSRRLGL